MTLTIDTGAQSPDATNSIPDWFVDLMPEGTTPDRLTHDYAYHLIGKLGSYRSMKFARQHLLQHWAFLRQLADSHPEVFDEVMVSYSEAFAAS